MEFQTFKELNIGLDKDFPLKVSNTVGIHSSSTMLHRHKCIEICYVKQGTGMYWIGGKNYSFEKEDVFIINSQEIHLAYNDREVIMQAILFEPNLLTGGSGYLFEIEYLLPFLEAGVCFENKLNKDIPYHRNITQTLLELEYEFNSKMSGYQLMIKSLLLKLASILVRNIEMNAMDARLPKKLQNNIRLKPLFDYIENNYQQPLKLDTLAAQVNMSGSNLSLIFKNTFGIPPIEYVIRTRVFKAAELLVNSELKIIDVALTCGFGSMPNFIAKFKKYTGMLPSEYRKNVK